MNSSNSNFHPHLSLLIPPPLLKYLLTNYHFNNIIRQSILENIFLYYLTFLYINSPPPSPSPSIHPQSPKEKSPQPHLNKNRFKWLSIKTKRSTKLCTACPHKDAVHYAKNMCSKCYHSKGRNKKSWNCSHTHKSHYALGLCHTCYQMKYIQKQVSNDIEQLLKSKHAKK